MNKHVFTIDATENFADVLTKTLLLEHPFSDLNDKNKANNSITLMQSLLFLPTRRSERTIREAFFRNNNNKPVLLPRIIPLGNIDEDELEFSLNIDGIEDLPEPASKMERNFLLMQLVQTMRKDINTTSALELASSLSELLDELYLEGIDFSKITNFDDSNLSKYWEDTKKFLEIILKNNTWDNILLSELGKIDPTKHQVLLFEKLCEKWQKEPPKFNVICAGSTGSQPSTAKLLDTVASLENGYVILPGLDLELDDESFEAVLDEPTHPQYNLAHLLKLMKIDRKDVKKLSFETNQNLTSQNRMRLISEAMRPAKTTNLWSNAKKFDEDVIKNVSYVECETQQNEALAISFLLRKVLEDKDKTACLVTPDRTLAKRVISNMKRWNIILDDATGKPLSESKEGNFLSLIFDFAHNDLDIYAFLALLKHPLTHCGLDYKEVKKFVRPIEKKLHDVCPHDSFEHLEKHITNIDAASLNVSKEDLEKFIKQNDELKGFLIKFKKCFEIDNGKNLFDLLKDDDKFYSFEEYLNAHIKVAKALAQTDNRTGEENLWNSQEGIDLCKLLNELNSNANLIFNVNSSNKGLHPYEYGELIKTFLSRTNSTNKYGTVKNLSILNSSEARMNKADVVILGELNEDIWPRQISQDPWICRQMRTNLNLPMPEKKISLSTHDFCQSFCAKEVIITRAKKIEGSPTDRSRLLMRLDTVLNLSNLKIKTNPVVDLVNNFYKPNPNDIVKPTGFNPPLKYRPKELWATYVEKLFKDPYNIYASKILNIQKLDEIDTPISVNIFGTIIHACIEDFTNKHPPKEILENQNLDFTSELYKELSNSFMKEFESQNLDLETKRFYTPKLDEIANVFVLNYLRVIKDNNTKNIETEKSLSLELKKSNNEIFTLKAKADRIDTLEDNSIQIYDYKTGVVPHKKHVHSCLKPQLTLEALILKESQNLNINEILYWGVSNKGKVTPICKKTSNREKTEEITPDDLINKTKEKLIKVLDRFDNEETAYEPSPNQGYMLDYNDYEHLERYDEWSTLDKSEQNSDDNE